MFGDNLLEQLRGMTKVKSRSERAKTDNFVFRLHYQVTSLIFLTASGILISSQFFGEPIKCFTSGSAHIEDGFASTINTMCWVTSTFTVNEHRCAHVGTEVPYAGIGILTPNRTPFNIHVTYRFLFFVLFLQGISFYMPHFIWKSWEREKMKMLSTDLDHPLLDRVRKGELLHKLTEYLLHGQMNGSIKYSFHLHFCELMNLVIVGLNIWITDSMFRREFIAYGIKAMSDIFSKSSDYDFNGGCNDPIKALFPPVAKCIMSEVGPSGSIFNRDNVCILPLNDFNAIFFKFTWIWFAFLLVTSVFWLLLRVVTFYSCKVRSFFLSRRAGTLPVSPSHSHDSGNCASQICSRVSYADWVILMQLGCNMDPLTYKYFLEYFCHQVLLKEVGKPKMIDKIYYSPV